MVVEIRLSLVEGGTRSGGVENGEKEEKPHYLAFWVPRWFSVQTFCPRSFLFFFSAQQAPVSVSELWELVMDREAWHAVIHGVSKSWT